MPDNNSNFSKSIKYFYAVRDSVPSYVNEITRLYQELTKKSYKDYKVLNQHITAFMSTQYCRNQEGAVKDGKDYRLYNLKKSRLLNTRCQISKSFVVDNAIAFYFKNATCMHDFIKDMRFKKDEIVYSAWSDPLKLYTFVVKFEKGVHINKLKIFRRKCGKMMYYSNRYGSWGVETKIALASSIYDRWFDPFAKKVIWDAKKVFEHARNAKALTLNDLYKRIEPYIAQYESYNKVAKSRSSNFISNDKKTPLLAKRCNTYIINKFVEKYNPYKRSQTRKDWKYAAECFMNEFIGKILYIRSKDITNDVLKISKAEITLLLRSLDIKTKIDANKFKRDMLRLLLELNLLKTDFYYKPKIECRTYKFNWNKIATFYRIIGIRLNNIFNFNRNIIMQKKDEFVELVERWISTNKERLLHCYMGPPPQR